MRGDAAVEVDAPTTEGGGSTCATNQDCAGIPFNVCDPTAHACTSLVTAECPEILGDYLNPHAVLFGAILPVGLQGLPAYLGGLPKAGDAIKAGLALAVDDFASDKNPNKGLPPLPQQTDARPLAIVVCTDGQSAATTTAATTHLAVKLHVPAIIGAADSTRSRLIVSTLKTLQKTDVLVMTPRSSDLVPADNAGDFTRLAPSDDVQGAALAALFASRESTIRASLTDGGTTPLKITVVHKADAYGNAVAAALKKAIHFNGSDTGTSPNYVEYNYGNPDDPGFNPSSFSSTASAVSRSNPNAVFLIGSSEIISTMLSAAEGTKPYYFLSDGVAVPELWEYLAAADASDSIRKRIVGTVTTGIAARYSPFSAAFKAKNPTLSPIVSGAAAAYDGFYLLAYSAAGLAGARPITGPNLLDGFGLLTQGGGALQVGVGPDAIGPTLVKLSGGEGINLDGASSPLAFDTTSRTAIGTTTQVWCVPNVGGHAAEAILSGQTVDASNTVQGSLSAACGQ